VVEDAAVILGGRRPARAIDHFRRERAAEPAARALCVLDRDDEAEAIAEAEPGLEFFTWPQRHIESYLLVPAAIRRHARHPRDADYIEQLVVRLAAHARYRGRSGGVDAKRLLSPKGPLSRELGWAISPAGVARSMRREEIHPEVHELFERVRAVSGLATDVPVVVKRADRETPR
jgi:hypothetical protein